MRDVPQNRGKSQEVAIPYMGVVQHSTYKSHMKTRILQEGKLPETDCGKELVISMSAKVCSNSCYPGVMLRWMYKLFL